MEIRAYDIDDEMIAATISDRAPRVRVYVPAGAAVVLGRGSKAEIETDLAAITEDGVPWLRRRGGGCAVVLDSGNVVVSAAIPVNSLGGSKSAFAGFSAWLAGTLAAMGIDGVRGDGISDLVRAGRKIGGSCIYQTNRVLYYTSTLLVAPDLDLVDRYLPHPPREPAYRRGRSHGAFMGRLADAVGDDDAVRFSIELGQRLRLTGRVPMVDAEQENQVRWRLPGGAETDNTQGAHGG